MPAPRAVATREGHAALLHAVTLQASAFKKRTVGHGDNAPDVLMGSGEDDRIYTAVLCLSADIEDAYTRAAAGSAMSEHDVASVPAVYALTDRSSAPEPSGAAAENEDFFATFGIK